MREKEGASPGESGQENEESAGQQLHHLCV